MDPLTTSALITAGGNALSQGFAGQEGYNPGKQHVRWADPYQGQLFQQQMQRGLSGAGDFGFGQAARAGTSTLQQAMADRGISPQSGVAASAQGSMLANAMAQDVAGRRNYIQGLMNTAPMQHTSDQGWEDYASYGRWGEPVRAPRLYSDQTAPGQMNSTQQAAVTRMNNMGVL